ncbi:MAG: acyl-CoA thioesterase [Planctomycetaceae bacterium]|nr:acyl-CoA thioesterase [Planctomycetaceae bacterium]
MTGSVPIPSAAKEALADFTTITSLPLQWGDMDAFGHVNNVVYIRWYESSRIDLLNSFDTEASMAPGGLGPILASITCDYKRQLHYPDTVHIGGRVGRTGRTSFDLEHAVYSEQLDAIAATGKSVVVLFNYDTNRPVRIPPKLLAQFQA